MRGGAMYYRPRVIILNFMLDFFCRIFGSFILFSIAGLDIYYIPALREQGDE